MRGKIVAVRFVITLSAGVILVLLVGWLQWKKHKANTKERLERVRRSLVEAGELDIHPYQFPVALSVDSRRLLVKKKTESAFAFLVYDKATLVAKLDLPNPQWEISWNPSGTAVSFLSEGSLPGVYVAYVWWITQGRAVTLGGPTMNKASFPLRWSPDGRHISYIAVTPEAERLIVLSVRGDGSGVEAVVDDVYPDAGMAWSEHSDSLVYAKRADDGFTLTRLNLRDKTSTDLDHLPDGKIKDLTWSPSSESIAMSYRGETDNYYRLALLSAAGHLIYCKADDGDVLSPVQYEDGETVEYILEKNSYQKIVVRHGCHAPVEMYRPQTGTGRLQVDGYHHRLVPFIEAQPGSPSRIVQPSDKPRSRLQSASSGNLSSASSKQLWLSGSSHSVAAWIWEPATDNATPRAIIMVHGGPHLHETNEWEPLREAFRRHGYIVLTPNYGGSSGYGKNYEGITDLDSQSEDMLAAVRYLTADRHVPQDHITIFASSYGTRVLLRALKSDPNLSPLIIFAPFLAAPFEVQDPIPFEGTVLAFHGRRDPISNPAIASQALQRVFPDAVSRKKLYWREFEDEAHGSNRISSLQEEYGTIICVLESSPCKAVW